MSCATKKLSTDSLKEPICKASGNVQFKNRNESYRANFELLYQSGPKTLVMNILSPVGSRAGRIEMTEGQGLWKDGTGATQIESNPRFGKFFRNDWYKELSYFMELSAEAPQRPRRRVECESGSKSSDYLRQCRVEQEDDVLTLQFAFLEC